MSGAQAFRPETDDQLLEAVRWLVSEDAPAELVGRGTKRRFGRPMQTEHTLDLSALAGIRLYEPDELVLSAGPGTPMADIEAALAEARQMLAFEPPDLSALLAGGDPDAAGGQRRDSLGGVIACNLAGPRRVTAGAARDHVLGVEGVGGHAMVFKTGGRVVKNVTGYDLSKLLTGSHGTLAAMTHLTVKVLPAPETEATLVLSDTDLADAGRLLTTGMAEPAAVSGAAWLPGRLAAGSFGDVGAGVVLLRLEGFAASVADRQAALAGRLGAGRLGAERSLTVLDAEAPADRWRGLRDALPLTVLNADAPLWRISVPPSAGAWILQALLRPETDDIGLLDWGGGLIWLAVDVAAPEGDAGETRVRAALAAVGGHATLVRAPDPIRAAAPVFQPQPSALAALTARVKESFDPKHLLNPGRMYAGI